MIASIPPIPPIPVGRWGPEPHPLDERTRAFAREHLGPPQSAPEPSLRPVRPGRLDAEAASALAPGVLVETGDEIRAHCSRGMSYLDLLAWRRAGEPMDAVDAVAFPEDHEQVVRLLEGCSAQGVVVVPVGGGTSVTGGITAAQGAAGPAPDERPVLAVSLSRMNRLLDLDRESGIATVQAGITGPELESALDGFTLGHFPQSWQRATIGGFIAARSSGQSSGGFGRIEDMLVGAQVATPVGSWEVGGHPAASTGPDLRHLVLGSEGTLGVITSAQLRVRVEPSLREYAAAVVPCGPDADFRPAIEAAMQLTRSPLRPSVLRISDPDETEALLTMSAPRGFAGSLFGGYLRTRRALPGAFVILGWEVDDPSVLAAARAFARSALGDAGGVWLGAGPGRSWARGRFDGPHLRDALMDDGYLVETFETVTRWSNLAGLHESVGAVARSVLGARSFVMAHISHTYETGASVYFTVLAGGWSDPQAARDRWRLAKTAITDALVDAGGALSHHHGIGRDHAPWLAAQIGSIGMDVLAAVKASVDPRGVMNPGVLLAGER